MEAGNQSVSFTKKWWGNENEAMKMTLVRLCPMADGVVPNNKDCTAGSLTLGSCFTHVLV